MAWIGIATTTDNHIVAANDDITLLELVSENEFDVVTRVYGVTDDEYAELKSGNYQFRLRYKNPRSVYLEPWERSQRAVTISDYYRIRLELITSIRGRYEHALGRFRTILSTQPWIYEKKAEEARSILTDPASPFVKDGFVADYAAETGIDSVVAAKIIDLKSRGLLDHLRKVERLRIRHFRLIKKAKNRDDALEILAEVDKDFYINMLL